MSKDPVQDGVDTVQHVLDLYSYGTPACLIADIFHWCERHGVKCDEQVKLAKSYVRADKKFDNHEE